MAAAFAAELAKRKPAPAVTRIGITDDVLQKVGGAHDIAARLTAHVKEALGQPQPMDVTSGRPAALRSAPRRRQRTCCAETQIVA